MAPTTRLLERWLWTPLSDHIAEIKANESEADCETHLRLMKPVRGPLPPALSKALAVYDRANAANYEADAAFQRSRAALDKAKAAHDKATAPIQYGRFTLSPRVTLAARIRAYATFSEAAAALERATTANQTALAALAASVETRMPAIWALHAAECPDCPWDGTTIFPTSSRREYRH